LSFIHYLSKKLNLNLMISKRLSTLVLSVLCTILTAGMLNAQTFNGSATNTAGNTSIPSINAGGCGVEPQTAATGGTRFNNAVAGLGTQVVVSVLVNFTHTFDGDLDIYLQAPNGQILELSTDNGGGNDNYTNTVFIGGAPNITTGVAPFTGNFAPEGSLTAGGCLPNITPTVTTLGGFTPGQNGTWQLIILDDAGGDSGIMSNWSITFGLACDFTVPQPFPQLNLTGTDPAICGYSGTITIPTTNCTGGELVTVQLDGVTLGQYAPGAVVNVSISSGNHVIRYSLPNSNFRTQNVVVADGVKPVITCPANMQINLDPGACAAVVNYQVTATDNCPFFINGTPLLFPQVLLPHGGGAITVAGNNLPGGNFFNLTNTSAAPVRITGYRVRFGSTAFGAVGSPQVVNTYISNGATFVGQTATAASWASTGVANVVVAGPNSELSQVNLATPYILNPGQTKGVYLFGVNASLVYNAAAGFLANNAQGPFNLTSGASSQALFGATILNRSPNVEIQWQTVGNATPVQTAGLPSGSEFPIGTTTNCFTIADAAGNTNSCCFTVQVLE
jgi:subtilisin-like proprotein convertase family protein